jgi:hypothetical protein
MSEPIALETKTYHVFLASPGDMQAERQSVRDFFEDINQQVFQHKNLSFEVLSWEHNVTFGMGRPQAIINAQTIEPCNC